MRAELDRLERDLIELEEINAVIDEIRAYVRRGREPQKARLARGHTHYGSQNQNLLTSMTHFAITI